MHTCYASLYRGAKRHSGDFIHNGDIRRKSCTWRGIAALVFRPWKRLDMPSRRYGVRKAARRLRKSRTLRNCVKSRAVPPAPNNGGARWRTRCLLHSCPAPLLLGAGGLQNRFYTVSKQKQVRQARRQCACQSSVHSVFLLAPAFGQELRAKQAKIMVYFVGQKTCLKWNALLDAKQRKCLPVRVGKGGFGIVFGPV